MLGLFDREVINKTEKPSNGESSFLALGFDAGLGESNKKTAAEVGGVVVERKFWVSKTVVDGREKYKDVLQPLPIEVSPFSLWLTMGKMLKERYLKEMEEIFTDFRESVFVDPETAKNQTFWVTFSQPELYWFTLKRYPQAVGKQNGEYYILGTEVVKMKLTVNTFHDRAIDQKRVIVTYCKNINMNPAFEKLRKFLRDRNTTRKNNWVKIFSNKKDQVERVPELDLDSPEFRVTENWIGDKSEAELYKSIWAQSDTDYLSNLNTKRLGYNPAKVSKDVRNYMMAENLRVSNDTDKYKERLNKWAQDKADPIKHLEPEYSGRDPRVLKKVSEAKKNDQQNQPKMFNSSSAFFVPVGSSSPSRAVAQNQVVNRNSDPYSFDIDSHLTESESQMAIELPEKTKDWRDLINKMDVSRGQHCNPTEIVKKIFDDKNFRLEDIHHADFNFLVNVFTESSLQMEKDHIQKIYNLGNTIIANIRNHRRLKFDQFEEYVLKFFKSCKEINQLENFSVEYEEHLLRENIEKLESLKVVVEKLSADNKDGVFETPERLEELKSEIYQLIVPGTHALMKTQLMTEIQDLAGQIKKPKTIRKRNRSDPEQVPNKKTAVEGRDINISERRRSSFTAAQEKLKSKKP